MAAIAISVCLVVTGLIAPTVANFGDPPFIKPTSQNNSLKYGNLSNAVVGRIQYVSLDENEDPPVILAELNITADANSAPFVSFVSPVNGNTMLEINISSANEVILNRALDYEDSRVPNDHTYKFSIFSTKNNFAQINLEIININDNPPVLQALNSSCKIPESCIGDSCNVTCFFELTDADGELTPETITVYEDSEESSHFRVQSVGHPDMYTWIYKLHVIKALDYESRTIHSLTLTANDTLFTDTISYLVYVINVRQRVPKWLTSPGVFQGQEKEEHSVTFTALDGDTGLNDEIAYDLHFNEGTIPYFNINNTTGVLTIGYIDRDILVSDFFSFNVLAYKKEYPEYNTSLPMTVIVLDIDDHTPNFTIGTDEKKFLEIYIDEKSTTLILNDTIIVRDPDLGLNGTFSILLKNDPVYSSNVSWSDNFLIVPASGYQDINVTIAIRNGTELDYEDPNWRDIFMEIVATERANQSHINQTNIIIHLNDINDEYPVFDKSEYNASLREDADVGNFVITCHATDADFNYTDPVMHTLLPESQTSLIIDPTSGNITVAVENPYNYQQQQEVFLQVLAEDSNTPAPHRTYTQLTIHIIDVNNEPPTITLPDTGSQPQVVENATTDTEVVMVTATDPDTGAELLFSIDWDKTYASKLGVTLKGDSEKYYKDCFYIKTEPNDNSMRNVKGIVRVKERNVFPTKNMDWGMFDTVFLTVKVTDLCTEHKFEQNMNRSTLLTVVIVDVNDNPPTFELHNYTASVAENTDPGTLLTSVTATDADGPGNNNVSYSILLVSTSLNQTATVQPEFVKIDSTSGKMYTGSFLIDCEVYQFFIYNITATDGVFNTVVTMNLTVIDKNDNFPNINSSLPDVHIAELSPNGTHVVYISSHDIDYSVPFHTCYYLIEYTIDATGEVRKFFSVDIDTGHLIVNLDGGEPLNLVKTKTLRYQIPLMIRDNFAERQTDPTISNAVRSMITVHIDDVNNNAPTFSNLPAGQTYLFTCTTHNVEGTVVMKNLEAPDLDQPGPNSWVKYNILNISLASGKQLTAPQDLFLIHNNDDNKTATITVGKNLTDFWGIYYITFYAQDEGIPPLNDTRTYSVHIQGFNDHDPVFTNPSPDMVHLKLKRKEQTAGSYAIMYDGMRFPDITATDEDEGENGRVSFKILGDDVALQYFKLSPEREDNSVSLLMLQGFSSDSPSVFMLQLEAGDHGTNPQRRTETNLKVLVMSQQSREPEYVDPVMKAQFTENITGMSEFVHLTPPIDPDYNMTLELYNMSDPIYYYLLNSTWDGMDHFQVDQKNGILRLKNMLDREKIDNYTLYILASKNNTQPIMIQSQKSVLEVDIKVLDVYDTPPVFQQSLYTGGIKNGDSRGKVIFIVTATDEDLNDTTSFTIENSVASTDQLRKLLGDNPFTMNKDNGVLSLNVDMDISNLQGYFRFDIRGTDRGNNSNVVPGNVYIVSDSNLITFQFNNPLTEVQENKFYVVNVFTKVFLWQCSIDDMSAGKSTTATSTYTNVRTHFIDLNKNLPIDASQIKLQLNVRSVISTLYNNFLAYNLEFNSFEDSTKAVSSGNMEQVLQIVLIVVSIVLGTMVVVLFVAFFYRTRYLTRRLEALSETKFGSKDSGLNRIGMAMPGTNQHAVDGSNPVWKNEEITANNLDTASIGSGDSELIGIEDDPQFNPHITGLNERRPSFPPGMNERRNSFNPLYSADPMEKQSEDSDSNMPKPTNMQFITDRNIPTTEL